MKAIRGNNSGEKLFNNGEMAAANGWQYESQRKKMWLMKSSNGAYSAGSLAKINESSALASSYLWHQYLNGSKCNSWRSQRNSKLIEMNNRRHASEK
jgi:hypothetical protein